jgi:hypothetical protein
MTAFLPTRRPTPFGGALFTPRLGRPTRHRHTRCRCRPLRLASPGRGSYGFTKGDRLLLRSCVALRCDEWALLITSGRVVVHGAREALVEASGDGLVEPQEAVAPIKGMMVDDYLIRPLDRPQVCVLSRRWPATLSRTKRQGYRSEERRLEKRYRQQFKVPARVPHLKRIRKLPSHARMPVDQVFRALDRTRTCGLPLRRLCRAVHGVATSPLSWIDSAAASAESGPIRGDRLSLAPAKGPVGLGHHRRGGRNGGLSIVAARSPVVVRVCAWRLAIWAACSRLLDVRRRR